MILSLSESQICHFCREAYKIQDCLNLLMQCKTHGPGEPAHIQQKRIITTMLENCDEWVKRRRRTVPKPTRRKRVKRSEPSEGQQKDDDRDL